MTAVSDGAGGCSAPAPAGVAAPGISVVVPAYNEERRLRPTLQSLIGYLRAAGPTTAAEVIVVDDGSGDGTARVVRELAVQEPRLRLLSLPDNRGKGRAVRLGVLASAGRRVLVTDADLATPIDQLPRLEAALDAGAAVAVGSRAPGPLRAAQGPLRRMLGAAGQTLIRTVAVPGIRDTQCGFKLFDGAKARAVFGRARIDGWGYDAEILREFNRSGWPIAEVPVRWAHQPGSKVRPAAYPRTLLDLARIRLRAPGPAAVRGGPPWTLVAIGFLVAAALLYAGLWADPGGRCLRDSGQDQTQWEWFFAVTADRLGQLRDPLFTDLQNAPDGVNLMANTAMPGLSVPLAPVTAAFGPAVTWAVVLTGGLAATAVAWSRLIARHLVAGRWAAVLGGGFCAFAPPMVSHANAHPNFCVLFMIPLIIDRLLRLCGGGRPGRDGVFLGLFVAYQVLLGEEALLLAATGLVVWAAAYAIARPRTARRAARPLLRGLAVAAVLCVSLLAYPLTWQFFGDQSYHSVPHGPTGNSLRALVEFAGRSLAGDEATADKLALNRTEQNAFFGWPLLALAAVVVVRWRREPLVRALAAVVVAGAWLSLGEPGPWSLLDELPLYSSVIASRMAMICVPALGMLLAVACERIRSLPSGGLRAAGSLTLAAALLPLTPTPYPVQDRSPVPAFVADGSWRAYVRPGRSLVPVPLPDEGDATALHWQTAAGLGFRIPGGYFMGPADPGGADRRGRYGAPPRPTAALLAGVRDSGRVPRIGPAERRAARADLDYWRADAVVLPPQPAERRLRAALVRLLGGPGARTGGVWVWDVRGGP